MMLRVLKPGEEGRCDKRDTEDRRCARAATYISEEDGCAERYCDDCRLEILSYIARQDQSYAHEETRGYGLDFDLRTGMLRLRQSARRAMLFVTPGRDGRPAPAPWLKAELCLFDRHLGRIRSWLRDHPEDDTDALRKRLTKILDKPRPKTEAP